MMDLQELGSSPEDPGGSVTTSAPPSRDVRGRYMDPPAEVQEALRAVQEQNAGEGGKSRVLKESSATKQEPTHTGAAQGPKPLWVISGCQDNQTSADASIGGTRQGALTWALLKALRDHQYTISYGDLLVAVRASLRGSYEQIPAMSTTSKANYGELYLSGGSGGDLSPLQDLLEYKIPEKLPEWRLACAAMLALLVACLLNPERDALEKHLTVSTRTVTRVDDPSIFARLIITLGLTSSSDTDLGSDQPTVHNHTKFLVYSVAHTRDSRSYLGIFGYWLELEQWGMRLLTSMPWDVCMMLAIFAVLFVRLQRQG